MRKQACLSLLFVIMLGIIYLPSQAATDITVKLNGKAVNFPDAKPYINSDNRTMVPVSFIAKALGCDVYWNVDGASVVTLRMGGNVILIKISEKRATYNGQVMALDTTACLKNSRTFVPLSFISQTFKSTVHWYPKTNTVEILTPKSDRDTTKVFDPLPEDFSKINKDIPQELYKYPYNKEAISRNGFATNKTLVEDWSKTRNYYDLNLILETAKGFKVLDDTVDYHTVGDDYKKKLLYFHSSGGNAVQIVDTWIKKVKDNQLIEEAKFITDMSLIYNATDGHVRVRGRFQNIYHSPSNKDFVKGEGMELDKWYEQDMEIALTMPVDNHTWDHGVWTVYKIVPLSERKLMKGE